MSWDLPVVKQGAVREARWNVVARKGGGEFRSCLGERSLKGGKRTAEEAGRCPVATTERRALRLVGGWAGGFMVSGRSIFLAT